MASTTFEDAVAALRNADCERDYIVVTHRIDRHLHYKISRLIASKRKKDACTVFLTTYGGDPNGGYRIARCLRHHYKHLRLVVPSFCKSAGTLIAIAADELAIGDFGELGPLDIQVRKASELEENSSGLDIMQALQAVTLHTQVSFHRMLVESRELGLSTKLCAEFAGQVAAGIAAPLFAQIDPIRLGEMQRATRVAYEYGRRLDEYRQNLRPGALERLISDYPAHGFVIDRKEATELFKRVSHPTDAESFFYNTIWHAVADQNDYDPEVIDLDAASSETGNENENSDAEVQNRNDREEVGEVDTRSDGDRGKHNSGQDAASADEQGLRIRPPRIALPAERRKTRAG